jgi:hypothetical protein
VVERRLKEIFVRAAAYGDEVPRFFYSHLFLASPEIRFLAIPEIRDMFPVSMVA